MPYVKRNIEIWYDTDKLKFDTDEKLLAFQAALGRMAFYGMSNDIKDNIARGGIDRDNEICLTYFRDAEVADKGGFTIGAVPREDGLRYTFHS